MSKVKARELRGKKKEELQKALSEQKIELASLQVKTSLLQFFYNFFLCKGFVFLNVNKLRLDEGFFASFFWYVNVNFSGYSEWQSGKGLAEAIAEILD